MRRQRGAMSSGQRRVKCLEGDQHLWKGKEGIVSLMKSSITMLSIGYEVLPLRCEPYFPALSQPTCQSRLSGRNINKEAGVFLLQVSEPQLFFNSFLFLIPVFIRRTVKPPRPQPWFNHISRLMIDVLFVFRSRRCQRVGCSGSRASYIILYNH